MNASADGLLRLSQWLSPAFPISGYAYSHGLEAEISLGHVSSAAELEAWLSVVLSAGAGRSDAILLCLALRAEADLDELSDLALALAGASERYAETRDQGAALARTLAALGEGDGVARAYPIALAAAARGLNVEPRIVAALYLQSFAANLVSAGVRFMPLGQEQGQEVLARLRPLCEAVAIEASSATLDDLGQAAFGADLAAIEHEELEVRIFRT